MKTTPFLRWNEVAALAILITTPLPAQGLNPGSASTYEVGAMGGIIVLLLAWTNRLRRQLRGRAAPAPAQHRTAGETEPERESKLKQAEVKLEQINKQLVEASRLAGMAEVASTVLHNVGNVLNSVNVSASVVADKIQNSKVSNLGKAVALMEEQGPKLGEFLTDDPKGRQLPAYLAGLAKHLAAEQQETLAELSSLCANVEHIKEIVAMQQAYAKVSGVQELLPATELVEDALRLNAGAVERHHVQVTRDYTPTPALVVDKHKVLQILVNLIRNAKYALDDRGHTDKRLILRVGPGEGATVRISVIDNGIGIPAENLARVFQRGFTTRKGGHGFGLHSGTLAARQLGGSLTCQSEGLNRGATFTLELPLATGKANA